MTAPPPHALLLVAGAGCLRVVAVTGATAGEAKAEAAHALGLPPGSLADTQLVYQDALLSDDQPLADAGLNFSRATLEGCGGALFPNGWFNSPYAKSFAKVLDITWPPLRQADYAVSFGWVAALLGALAASRLLLP